MRIPSYIRRRGDLWGGKVGGRVSKGGKASRTDAVDGYPRRQPLLDMRDHAGRDLGVCRAVEVVIVDVKDGVGVCRAGRLERDGDEVLPKDLGEHRGAQGTVLVEDLVAYILYEEEKSDKPMVSSAHPQLLKTPYRSPCLTFSAQRLTFLLSLSKREKRGIKQLNSPRPESFPCTAS